MLYNYFISFSAMRVDTLYNDTCIPPKSHNNLIINNTIYSTNKPIETIQDIREIEEHLYIKYVNDLSYSHQHIGNNSHNGFDWCIRIISFRTL